MDKIEKLNMKKSLGYTYKIKLETLTPIHIGTGNYLSSKSALLNDNQEIIDQSQVTTARPLEISEFVKSNNRVFVPGSSLKGAIRTAILFNWLKDAGVESLKQWLKEIQKIIENKSIYLKNKAYVIHNGNNNYRGYNNIIEKSCFSDFKNMASLRITDSGFIEDRNTLVYELKRYFLTSNYRGIPTFYECIVSNVEADFRLNVDYLFKNQHNNKEEFYHLINKHFNSEESIIRLLNNHSKALLEYELSVFVEDEIINEEIDGYKELIKSLYREINNDKHSAFIRLGAGKMQFHQTIAVSICNLEGKNEAENDWLFDCWENYKIYMKNFKEKEVEFPYPKTRALTIIDQLPLGWVKLKFV